MPVVKWVFEDPAELDSYTFEINPNAGGSPNYRKNITQQNTVAPNGRTILFEGSTQPQELSFSGVILSEEQLNAFVTWWEKRRQIKVTDDLGRSFWIYLTSFEPTRVRARSHPWKHTYNCSAFILDWAIDEDPPDEPDAAPPPPLNVTFTPYIPTLTFGEEM